MCIESSKIHQCTRKDALYRLTTLRELATTEANGRFLCVASTFVSKSEMNEAVEAHCVRLLQSERFSVTKLHHSVFPKPRVYLLDATFSVMFDEFIVKIDKFLSVQAYLLNERTCQRLDQLESSLGDFRFLDFRSLGDHEALLAIDFDTSTETELPQTFCCAGKRLELPWPTFLPV